MNAAALKISTAAPATNWSQWIAADQAAPLLGLSRDHLSRRCRDEWQALGVARLDQAPGDARKRWWVLRSHDERLVRHTAAIATLEQQGVPRHKAMEARQRRLCVLEFRKARAQRTPDAVERQWLPPLLKQLQADHPSIRITRTALYKWDKHYKRPADLMLLVDRRGGAKSAIDAQCIEHFRVLYLDARKRSAKQCHERTQIYAARHGLTWCHARTAQAKLDSWIDPVAQAYHRDPEVYKSRYLPTLKQDPEAHKAGRYWVSDHSTLDFFVEESGQQFRPVLTTFQDWRTRKIVGWTLAKTPSSDTILLAFRDAMLDKTNMGGPSELGFDNGKDYDSLLFDGRSKLERRREKRGDFELSTGAFKGIMGELNIQLHFSQPYGPNGKARQENYYKTVHDWFCREMPSYVGKDPLSRPHDYDKRVAAEGMPTLGYARERFADFIRAWNNREDHQIEDLKQDGRKLSPNQAMEQWCRDRRMFAPGVLDLMLMHHDRAVSVTKQGVSIRIAGTLHHYGLMQHELLPYQGSKRKIRPAYDPTDCRTIHCWDAETHELVCIASHNTMGGGATPVGREALSQHLRQVNEQHKLLKAQGLGNVVTKQSLAARSAMELGGDTRPPVEPVTETIAPVSTRFDGQDDEHNRHQMKQAAGAEHDAPRPSSDPDAPDRPAISREDFMSRLDPDGGLDAPDEPARTLHSEAIDEDLAPLARIGDPAPDPTANDGPLRQQETTEFLPDDGTDAVDERPRDLLAELYDDED